MTELEQIAALLKALRDIKECAGHPARVHRLASLALETNAEAQTPARASSGTQPPGYDV